jgi:hemerythrin HHE cation binding domain-containing protein
MELKMTVDTRTAHGVHEELQQEALGLRVAAERVPTLSTYERSEERRRILGLLHGKVEPHMGSEELLLYPQVGDRLGGELVKASLNYDHLAIRHWIELLAAADVTDTARLQALLYGLDALIRVQMWKENELVLAALESPSLQLALAG